MTVKGLWVDDERPLPSDYAADGWDITTTSWGALVALETNQYEIISLDHDLGCFVGNKEITGYDILTWLIYRKQDGNYVPTEVRIHTANPVGRKNMTETLDRYW